MNYEKTNLLQTWSESDSFTMERYTQFNRHIDKKNATTLYVNCNTGRDGAIFEEIMPAAKLYGLEVVEQRVEKILYKSLMDLENMYDNFFDYVVAGEVIEHIAPREMENFIATIYRILKPGGKTILTTPNPDALLVKPGRTAVYNHPSHLSIMNSNELRKKLAHASCKNISVMGSGKVTRYLPEKFPLLFPFGSYLIKASK